MTYNIVTIFPEFFASPLAVGQMGKAIEAGLVNVNLVNPRRFAINRHKHVDDRPFGGGPGMVMQAEPLYRAIESIPNPGRLLLMSPSGRQFDEACARELAQCGNVTLICGRYEGVDQRLQELLPIEEIRTGNVILNGGETAALMVMEGASRFLPSYLGKEESLLEESLVNGLLEYPHYTRPRIFMEKETPSVLTGGNHAEIADWRRKRSLQKTLAKEPCLLEEADLSHADVKYLADIGRKRISRNLSICLFHYPVYLEKDKIGVSSLTNLDVHDIARVCKSYGLGPFFVLTPLQKQLDLLRQLTGHWLKGPGGKSNPDRKAALECVVPVSSVEELEKKAREHFGIDAGFVITSAKWPDKKQANPLSIATFRNMLEKRPFILCLGTAQGLAEKNLQFDFLRLKPLRFLDYNHLSVRSAAAIITDRLFGDFL